MTGPINTRMTAIEWSLLVTLSILWGGSFLFIKVAVGSVPPMTVVAVRVAGAAVFLYLALLVRRAPLPTAPEVWAAFILMGILNNVIPFTLIAWGQIQLTAGLASILNATTPFFTVMVAHFATIDERMTPLRVVGIIIAFTGVTVMVGADALLYATDRLAAQFAVLGGSVSYALSAVYGRRFARLKVEPMTAAAGQMIAATVMMVPLALLIDRPWTLPMPGPEVLGALLGLAFLATFIAYTIYYRILATAGSVNLMLVTFLVPVSAILLGATVLGERLTANHYLGMAAIGLGLAAVDGRPFALLRRFRA